METKENTQPASGGAAEFVTQSAVMSFAPINRIHQHLVGLHCYSFDRTRAVPSHHFCSCTPEKGIRQCIIYDSDEADARLIGIEYVVDEAIFEALPEEEKKYWHSHKFEVESGMLQLGTKSLVPGAGADLAEQNAMKELQQTYGKTIHTWAVDDPASAKVPMGPPSVMKSFLPSDTLSPALVSDYEKITGSSLEHKKGLRAQYLDLAYAPLPGADVEEHGKGLALEPEEVEVKRGEVSWQGQKSLKEYHD